MVEMLSAEGLRAFASAARPAERSWAALIAADCAMRLGSLPTTYGRAGVVTQLRRLLDAVECFGRCGCDVVGGPEHWLVETDLTFCQPRLRPVPCVISLRTDGGLVQDVRFYLDLAAVPLDGLAPPAPSPGGRC